MTDTNKKPIILGMIGFISAGKDTAADFLVNEYNFRRDSFANTLKDAVASIFGWDRTLLEGRTAESRAWREQVDTWWAERLGINELTPRWVLQHVGTEVFRQYFHDDIWIASLENKIRKTQDNVVISDVRFRHEIKAIQRSGGRVIRIRRGPDPEWYNDAIAMNAGPRNMSWALSSEKIKKLGIHASETAWVGCPTDAEISNDGTVDELFSQIKKLL